MTLCVPRCTYFPLLPLFIEPIRCQDDPIVIDDEDNFAQREEAA